MDVGLDLAELLNVLIPYVYVTKPAIWLLVEYWERHIAPDTNFTKSFFSIFQREILLSNIVGEHQTRSCYTG